MTHKFKTLAIVGRPNVGKSTLFNRLAGRKQAIVDDQPGVTRDRKLGHGRVGDLEFDMFDTPGLESTDNDSLEGRMFKQSMKALEEADVALLVFDAIEGLTPRDEFFARIIRQASIPVILVANKAEGKGLEPNITDGYRLGFDTPVAISAEHGEGLAELYEALLPYLDTGAPVVTEKKKKKSDLEALIPAGDEEDDFDEQAPLHIAIVGRPNVGKSTLMNTLLGEERMLTGPEAGITRDAITVEFTYKGRLLKLCDTAGMRRKSRVQERLERMSVGESTHAICFAEVVLLVLDATQPLEKQDNTIAALIEREGRGCVVVLNKWDLVKEKDALLEELRSRMLDVMPQFKGIPLVPISAMNNKNIDKMMQAAFEIHKLWNTRITTSELNRWLEEALYTHTPPLIKGRRFKIRYATQAKTRPPTFILFSNQSGKETSGYVRYLTNHLRDVFKLPGVPLRVILKTGENPYAEVKKR
jgi:GTP-binding protein